PDDFHFLRGEILVPAELLQHTKREFGVAVLDFGPGRVRPLGEKIVVLPLLDLLPVLDPLVRDDTLDAEAGAKGAASFAHRQVGVIEDWGPGMPQFRASPAGPGQSVVIAADLGIVLWRSECDQVEFMLIAHMRLEPL